MKIPKERLEKYRNLKREFSEEEYINIHPIQRGGVLTEEAMKALIEFGDGYSVCDFCPPKEARLDMITRPPIRDFYKDLAKFLGMDYVRVVTRCREAIFIAFKMLSEPNDYVIIDSNAHYSTYLAAELSELRIKEVPNSGYPEFKVNLEAYIDKIEEVKKEKGKLPSAILLTHVDYLYGNLNDAKIVGKIAKDYNIPFILNCAYSAGVMPINGKELGADIITGSGHKSWAASAPTGILAINESLKEKILARSKISGDITKREFKAKEVALLGCTVMGAPLITLMASFPKIVERVEKWEEEINKIRYLVSELERIEGFKQLGIRPKLHTLTHMESESFYKVSINHKRKGFFLYEELKERKIVGIQPGLTKHFKFNTYGLTWEQIKYIRDAFFDIARKYNVNIK
jgi:Sep-tRNA:Cys-tRNA synthetase